MERDKTIEILKALADGIDPATGQAFPDGSAYQQPDTVRALFSAIHVLGGSAPRPATKPASPGKAAVEKDTPENAGMPWSREEDARLAQAYDSGKSIEDLAQEHKRSQWAIEARLVRMEKIPASPSGFVPRSSPRKAVTT
jgi:hypothetical protein